MVSLPIALGSALSSSRPLPPPPRSVPSDEDEGCNGVGGGGVRGSTKRGRRRRIPIGDGPLLAVCPDDGPSSSSVRAAHLMIHYYDEAFVTATADVKARESVRSNGEEGGNSMRDREADPPRTMTVLTTYAELHVEVSPIGEPFTAKSRTRTVRVRLFSSTAKESYGDGRACDHFVADGGDLYEESDGMTCIEEAEAVGCGKKMARMRRRRYKFGDVCPSAAFSSDGRYLSCLVPHPVPISSMDEEDEVVLAEDRHENDGRGAKSLVDEPLAPSLSSLIVFTLKRPHHPSPRTTGAAKMMVPPPSWAAHHPTISGDGSFRDDDAAASAAHVVPFEPRFVSFPPSLSESHVPRLDRISSICNASSFAGRGGGKEGLSAGSTGAVSVLLAGCDDGTILAVGYRRARVAGVLYRPSSSSHRRTRTVAGEGVSAGGALAASAAALSSEGSFHGTDDSTAMATEIAATNGHVDWRIHSPYPSERKRPPVAERLVSYRRRRREDAVGAVGPNAPVHMSHLSPAVPFDPEAARSGAGRLACVRRDGSVVAYRSVFVPASAPPPQLPASRGHHPTTAAAPPPPPSPHTPSHPFVALSPRPVVPPSESRGGRRRIPPSDDGERSLLDAAARVVGAPSLVPPSPVVRTPTASFAGHATPMTVERHTPLSALRESVGIKDGGGGIPEGFPGPPPLVPAPAPMTDGSPSRHGEDGATLSGGAAASEATSSMVAETTIPPPPFPDPHPPLHPPLQRQPSSQPHPGGGGGGHAGRGDHHGGHAGLMLRIERLAELRRDATSSADTAMDGSSSPHMLPRFVRAAWIDPHALAVLANPVYDELDDDGDGDGATLSGNGHPPSPSTKALTADVIAQVWSVRDGGGSRSRSSGSLTLLSVLRMNAEALSESANGSFQCHSSNVVTDDRDDDETDDGDACCPPLAQYGSTLSVATDSLSGCLAVSSSVPVVKTGLTSSPDEVRTPHSRFAAPCRPESTDSDFGNTGGNGTATPGLIRSSPRVGSARRRQSVRARPFVCIWEWRTGVRGVTLAADAAKNNRSGGISTSMCSILRFVRGGHSLVHVYGPFFPSNRGACLRIGKDAYSLGALSPISVRSFPTDATVAVAVHVEEASPLLLSSTSVSFPRLAPLSAAAPTLDSTLQWTEARLPHGYLASFGPPVVVAAGRRLGRSVAVASDRGVCVLDLARTRTVDVDDVDAADTPPARSTPCVAGFGCPTGGDWDVVPAGMRNARPKWRVFQNESQESSFRVFAMTWWERSSVADEGPESSTNRKATEWRSEDLLIAVVQYLSVPMKNGQDDEKQLYLVSWSRRRLGMGEHQLLQDADDMDADDSIARKGVALPRGLRPSSMSILSEPSPESGRAILLLSSPYPTQSVAAEGGGVGDGCIAYVAFRVQVTEDVIPTDDAYGREETKRRVLSRLCSTGRIVPCSGNDEWSGARGHNSEVAERSESHSGASTFVAGGSFHFDLREEERGFDVHDYVATVGVIRAHGDGLDAVCVTPSGPYFGGRVIAAGDCEAQKIVAKYWLSDVCNSTNCNSCSKGPFGNSFEWTIACSDGMVCCWSVRFFDSNGQAVLINSPEFLLSHPSKDSSRKRVSCIFDAADQLQPPSVVSVAVWYPPTESDGIAPDEDSQPQCCSLLGQVFVVGDVSLMNGASTNDNEIALGPLVSSSSGCVLYAGQSSKRVRRHLADAGTGCTATNSDTLTIQVFGASGCVVAPPALAASLFGSILYAAVPIFCSHSLNGGVADDFDSSMVALQRKRKAARAYARYLLFAGQNEDAVLNALRVVILRTVDSLSVSRKALQRSNGTCSARPMMSELYARAVLFEVTQAAKAVFTPLRFSSLFLGIGRQLEPHHFDNLFPLPLSLPESPSDACDAGRSYHDPLVETKQRNLETIEDLFFASVESGSMSISSSALPMLSSQRTSQKHCTELMRHGLVAVEESIVKCKSKELDFSVDQRLFIQQLYRFGLKIEDSVEPVCAESESSGSSIGSSVDELLNDSDDTSSNDSSTDSSRVADSLPHSDEENDSSDAEDENSDINETPSAPLQSTPKRSIRKSLGAVTPSIGLSRIVTMVSPILFSTPRKDEELDEKAISEAASTFISSVFRESENEIVSTFVNSEVTDQEPAERAASNESPTDDASSASSSSIIPSTRTIEQPKMESSVAGVVGRYIVTSSCFVVSSSNGWQKAVVVARLILGDSRLYQSLSSMESRNANRIAQSCSAQDLETFSLMLSQKNHVLSHCAPSGDNSKGGSLASTLLDMILECCYQTKPESASLIFDLILSLLMRHDVCLDIQQMSVPLVMAGVIAGHCCGRINEIVGQDWSTSLVGKCYKSVHESVGRSV